MVEIGFTGKEQELSSGNSWAVQCEEQEFGDKMIVDVDITKYRVQPFKSYKVCISVEDPTSGSYLRRVCTHLFSFERAVPYVPTIKKAEEAVSAKLSTEKQSEKSENESEVEEESENESDLRSQEEEERRGQGEELGGGCLDGGGGEKRQSLGSYHSIPLPACGRGGGRHWRAPPRPA